MTENNTKLGKQDTDADMTPGTPAPHHQPGRPWSLWLKLGLLLVAGLALLPATTSPALTIAITMAGLAATEMVTMVIFSRSLLHRRPRLTASPHHQLKQPNETSAQLEEIINRLRSTMEELRQHPELALAARYALQELNELNTEQCKSHLN